MPKALRVPKLPYVDFVLAETRAGNERVAEAWQKDMHWGYWPEPDLPDRSVAVSPQPLRVPISDLRQMAHPPNAIGGSAHQGR